MVALQILVNGVLAGGVYALVAVGLTLVFAVAGLVNFAQGALVTTGLYLTFVATGTFGLNVYAAAVPVAGVAFLLGYAAMYAAEPIMRRPPLSQLTLTLGLMVSVEALLEAVFHSDPVRVRGMRLPSIHLGELYVAAPRLIAFGGAMAVSALLWLFLRYTRWGMAVRAVALNPAMAQLVGIPARKVLALAFGLATAAAAIAGVLMSPFLTISPYVGHSFLAASFAAIVVGTKGNIPGAFLGGLLIGVAEAAGVLLLGDSVKDAVFFAVILVTLMFRPEGLFSDVRR